jgi:hypothetical protein
MITDLTSRLVINEDHGVDNFLNSVEYRLANYYRQHKLGKSTPQTGQWGEITSGFKIRFTREAKDNLGKWLIIIN